jgi:GNAT superfamily N-acetyltransferase
VIYLENKRCNPYNSIDMGKLHGSDYTLARRIEALEAAGGLAAARSLQTHGGTQSAVEQHLGGYAVFAGVTSPMTHALGIGMDGASTHAAFEAMERFFLERGSPVLIDLCPLADESVQGCVRQRGYHIIEFNNVMACALDRDPPSAGPVEITPVGPDERTTWGSLIVEGFSEMQPMTDDAAGTVTNSCYNYECQIAHIEGSRAGGSGMNLHNGAAAFFGDATLTRFRGRGVQQALIAHRMRLARARGCDLAVACVIPGSASHRNYERLGFELVYMRVNVIRSLDGARPA